MNLIMFKLTGKEAVSKGKQMVHVSLDSVKAFRKLLFNNAYKIGKQV